MKWETPYAVKTMAALLILLSNTDTTCAFRVLYPQFPLNTKQADEPYQLEYLKCTEKGIDCSLFDFDDFQNGGEFRPRPKITPGERVLYRGWMMTPKTYQRLCREIERREAHPVTSAAGYTQCHHLPGWYSSCEDLTAETRFFDTTDLENVPAAAEKLGWDGFFVKDFVKSNTGDKGSMAQTPSEISEILNELESYRGELEGGIALRKKENYNIDTERRFFVVKQKPYGPDGEIPALVQTVAERVDATFFSVDIVQSNEGDWRLVELGDGQVSDMKEWPLENFVVQVLSALAEDGVAPTT